MTRKEKFTPLWREAAPFPGTFRSIFKWGDPLSFKHPNEKLYEQLKKSFNMTDDDFAQAREQGDELVQCRKKIKLKRAQISAIEKIVGHENVSTEGYDRVRFSRGKTIEEAMRLRAGDIGDVSDLVVHPRHKADVQKIVQYCHAQKIPIYVYGGGSSVTFGLNPSKGGVTLVLSTHMNRFIELNELNHTATVQAGIMGPDYEYQLNNAPEKFNTKGRYTCGHFPQSFEYSSVGGWIVTLGAGQASTYYGDACDLVISQEYVTPAGTFKTLNYPATATGPKINDIMIGSEGSFGILVEATMKVYKYMPENRQHFGFIFPSWEQAVDACREVSQGEFGMPAVFRVSDQEETHIGLKLYGIDGTILDKLMILRGYKPMRRCLLIGSSEGHKSFTKNVKKQIKKICRNHGGLYLTGYAAKQWEPGRYKDPYLREDLHDYGIITDTLETAVTWDRIHQVHQQVRAFIKNRPNTICMTHASHFYPQGTNLYFIFIAKINSVKAYKKFQDGIIDRIYKSGGSLSHHHGVGKMISPWMEQHLGREQMNVLRSLKKHFDPNNIMNPGGQMGLDRKQKK